MIRRRWIGIGVLVLLLVAISEMYRPRMLIPVFDRSLLTVIGVLVLLYAFTRIEAIDSIEWHRVSVPAVERAPAPAIPGATVRSALTLWTPHRSIEHEGDVVEGLREIAATVITTTTDQTDVLAHSAIERGTWTADPYAASLLGDGVDERTRRTRVLELFAPQVVHRRAIRHTVDAIATVAGASTAPPRRRDALRDWSVLLTGSRLAMSDEEQESTTIAAHEPLTMPTDQWIGIGVVALITIGIGLLIASPSILLAGVVGIAFATYATALPTNQVALSVERHVSPERPAPGDPLDVEVTVRNDGPTAIADLRVIDGVPAALTVTEGSPRGATTLMPGQRTTIQYTCRSRRGRHEFGPPMLIARNLPGSEQTISYLDASTVVTCPVETAPVSLPTSIFERELGPIGTIPGSTGGSGVEFYATRAYRPGDPMNSVDWNRFARTGQLATREYRAERAAGVVIAIDATTSAYFAPTVDSDHALDRAVNAAGRLFVSGLVAGHRVGITTLGPRECWLAPGVGRDHRVRGIHLLTVHPALSPIPPAYGAASATDIARLGRRIRSDTRIVVISPLCDQTAIDSVRELAAGGRSAVVISPDPTTDQTPWTRLAQTRRHTAIEGFRQLGIPVHTWDWNESVETVLAGWQP